MGSISVAMATYNGEEFIEKQLESIISQTIPVFELVICDDCSTDSTWSILCQYAKKYSFIKIYRNETNIGCVRNFEKAIGLCSGDYIALSDQDDIWMPEHLQVLYDGIGEKICSVGDAELIDQYGNKLGRKLNYSVNLDYIPKDDISKAYFIMFYGNPYHGCLMLFKREFFNIALPIPEGVKVHDVWFSILACFYHGIQPIGDVITLYRRHDKTITDKKIRKIRVRALVSHLLFNRSTYRPLMIAEIKCRISKLDEDQLAFIKQADQYFKRKRYCFGRFLNFLFELKYYRLIFGCKF